MAVQNTKNFQTFIETQEISDDKAKNIQKVIGAFSEYIVAVNPQYTYNKTYLNAYVDDFIQCQKALKQTYQLLTNEILNKIREIGIENECRITIDEAWKFEKGIVRLNNSINPYNVKRNKIQIEFELIDDSGFVIAEEINIDNSYENVLNNCISILDERRKELFRNEA